MARKLNCTQKSGSTGLKASDSFTIDRFEYQVLQEDRSPVFSLFVAKYDKDDFLGEYRLIGFIEINQHCGLFLHLTNKAQKVKYDQIMDRLVN